MNYVNTFNNILLPIILSIIASLIIVLFNNLITVMCKSKIREHMYLLSNEVQSLYRDIADGLHSESIIKCIDCINKVNMIQSEIRPMNFILNGQRVFIQALLMEINDELACYRDLDFIWSTTDKEMLKENRETIFLTKLTNIIGYEANQYRIWGEGEPLKYTYKIHINLDILNNLMNGYNMGGAVLEAFRHYINREILDECHIDDLIGKKFIKGRDKDVKKYAVLTEYQYYKLMCKIHRQYRRYERKNPVAFG